MSVQTATKHIPTALPLKQLHLHTANVSDETETPISIDKQQLTLFCHCQPNWKILKPSVIILWYTEKSA